MKPVSQSLWRSLWLSLWAAWLTLVLPACSTGTRSPVEDLDQGPGLETIAIIGTNDIHGSLPPFHLKTRDSDATDYDAAGVAMLASYIQVVRSEFGGRSLWLDGGDEFQGSLESNVKRGAPMVDFFNLEGLDGAAIGNHEFDYGPLPGNSDVLSSLKARMEQSKFPRLAANVFDKATGNPYPFPNTLPGKIYDVGGIKVGVLGLSTRDTPKTTRSEFVKDLAFSDLHEATLREASDLRQHGAQVVLIVSHAGLDCETGHTRAGLAVRKQSDPQGDCDPGGEIVQLLHSLPSGTIDGVVSGHTHTVIHHWVAGVPVIQAGSTGRYLNVLYLTFDKNQNKLVSDKTRIEGPIPICEKVFENQGDCNGEKPAPKEGRGPLVQAHFHGRSMHPASEVVAQLEPLMTELAPVRDRIVGHAAQPMEHNRQGESMLGNLVADSVRAAAHTDVALVNSGGIRASIEAGPIKYVSVFRALPFENSIATLHLTGRELKTVLRIAESGSRGFFPFSGVRLKVIDPKFDAPSTDLNGDGKIETWEVNRLLEVKLDNGKPIEDAKTYTLSTIDFLVTGGDDLGWIMQKIPASRIEWNTGGLAREAVVDYLAHNDPVNTKEKPLVDENSPRLKFEKPKGSVGHSRRRRR